MERQIFRYLYNSSVEIECEGGEAKSIFLSFIKTLVDTIGYVLILCFSLMEDFVSVELIKRLLLHVVGVKKLKLVTEGANVTCLHLLNEVKALHLDESRLQVGPHVVQLWLQNERIQETVSAGLEVCLVVVRKAEVHNSSHIVGTQVDGQLVGTDRLISLK